MRSRGNIVIIGGGGHIGLPLAIALAEFHRVIIHDTDIERVRAIRSGRYPHKEKGGQKALLAVRERLSATDNLADCQGCRVAIVATYHMAACATAKLLSHLKRVRLIVLRGTVEIGTSRNIARALEAESGHPVDLAYCPERSVEGNSFQEMRNLPQLVGCESRRVFNAVRGTLRYAPSFVPLNLEEAEAAKLITNAYRFAHFSLANEIYLMLMEKEIDPRRVFRAATRGYERMSSFPRAGFVGGPCLIKDTQLFLRGDNGAHNMLRDALQLNESLALHLVDIVKRQVVLRNATVGLLGCTFKAESNDLRCSPSKQLIELLAPQAQRVLCTDPYSSGQHIADLQKTIELADVLFVVTPHRPYYGLRIPGDKLVIDPWGILRVGEGQAGGKARHSSIAELASPAHRKLMDLTTDLGSTVPLAAQ